MESSTSYSKLYAFTGIHLHTNTAILQTEKYGK